MSAHKLEKVQELWLLAMLDDEGELTDEACQELQKAREEMARGKFVSHEEIKAKYG